MKKNIIMLLFVGIFCMQITGCAMAADELIHGTETVLQGSDGYREFTGEDVHSPLIVFPDKEIESISEEFYYEFRDEIFSPVCQIYLKKEYNTDEFTKEMERLAAEQLSYAGQTNQLYFDKDNFSSEAYGCDRTYPGYRRQTVQKYYRIYNYRNNRAGKTARSTEN